jgi:hypothetical protein
MNEKGIDPDGLANESDISPLVASSEDNYPSLGFTTHTDNGVINIVVHYPEGRYDLARRVFNELMAERRNIGHFVVDLKGAFGTEEFSIGEEPNDFEIV